MLGLDDGYPALAIFDHFKGQLTQNITGRESYPLCVDSCWTAAAIGYIYQQSSLISFQIGTQMN